MELTNEIKEQAKILIQQGAALPAQIKVAPHFYVAQHEDSSIRAFGSVEVDGAFFKIGTMKAKQ